MTAFTVPAALFTHLQLHPSRLY